MIVYEVLIEVDLDVEERLHKWLPGHIKEVLAQGRFVKASWWKAIGLPSGYDHPTFLVHYWAENTATVKQYLQGPAFMLRKRGQEAFGDSLRVLRRAMLTEEQTLVNEEKAG